MKAIFTKLTAQNAVNYSGNKETTNTLRLVAITKGEIITIADARFYMSRSSSASVVYCALCVNGKIQSRLAKEDRTNNTTPAPLIVSVSGKGTAGGYGYHKESAALQEAFTSAGIEIYGSPYSDDKDTKENLKKQCHIGGCGSNSMSVALMAIGRALGYTTKQLKVI